MRLQVCSQMWFDPILQRFARTFPNVELRYRTRLESFEATANRVSPDIVDLASGKRELIEADYLCDGANSMVRRTLGIRLDGQTLGHPVNLYFRAGGLLEICGRKPATFFVAADHGSVWSNARIVDPANAMWRLMVRSVVRSQWNGSARASGRSAVWLQNVTRMGGSFLRVTPSISCHRPARWA
jgi:2-polyprenyl-6-methoxyphenol hydroxylase-like FAD-dependent oxidoreductase